MKASNVTVQPLPVEYRKIEPNFRPMHPPLFPYGDPTVADVELALDLIQALDPESRDWYASSERTLRSWLRRFDV